MAARRCYKLRVAILRASDFIGPRAVAGGLGGRVFHPALAGQAASVLGNPRLPHTLIPMCAWAMIRLGAADCALGQIRKVPNAASHPLI